MIDVACEYCARKSPIYAAAPCCQERLAADMRRHLVVRAAIAVCGLDSRQERRKMLVGYGVKHGEDFRLEVEAEVLLRWRGRA